jgi:diguanylate cyclase (GGDEF)-like protein
VRLSTAVFARVPALPFFGIVAIALASTFLRTEETDWRLVGLAAIVSCIVTASALATPWTRLPDWALLSLPIWCDVVIALLRHAQGGATSGYGPLTILPVVWVGVRLTRRSVLAITACTFALFAVPIAVVGAPEYPGTGLRGAVLYLIVSLLVGFAANRVIADQRHHAELARKRAADLQRLAVTQNVIAGTHLEVDGVMAVVVDEAQALTGADAAVVELPEGDDLVYRAVAGAAEPHLRLRVRADSTLSSECLRTGTTLISDDTETDPRVDGDACRRVGARSMVVVPLGHDGRTLGVLKVYSGAPHAFSSDTVNLLTSLASLIGSALARAELVSRLREQAATDELTGLPNRRAWYEHLELAFARARRTTQALSVIGLDVDGLKEVNDQEGHAAGDRLLVEVASRWSSVLRETDLVARVGGDEFAVLLEDAGETEAADVLRRLQDAVGERHSASGGAATWDGVEQADDLMRRADERMYAQKLSRR